MLSSERLTRWFVQAASSGVHVKLGYALTAIALPRLKKHGMIPAIVPVPSLSETPPLSREGPLNGSHPSEGSLPTEGEYVSEADMYARAAAAQQIPPVWVPPA